MCPRSLKPGTEVSLVSSSRLFPLDHSSTSEIISLWYLFAICFCLQHKEQEIKLVLKTVLTRTLIECLDIVSLDLFQMCLAYPGEAVALWDRDISEEVTSDLGNVTQFCRAAWQCWPGRAGEVQRLLSVHIQQLPPS